MTAKTKPLFDVIQQFRCRGLLHFDVGEEFFSCIFEAGPKDVYHIINNQEAIMIPLSCDYANWRILLVMSLYI